MRFLIALLFLMMGCSKAITTSKVFYNKSNIQDIPSSETTKYLKVHLADGRLLVYQTYFLNDSERRVVGKGSLYSINRRQISNTSEISVNYDDIVLLETNDFYGYNAISPILMTLTVFYSGITIPCIFDPKACFGSCPTFYIHQDDSLIIQAEGFSSSISKSMEEEDIDFLSAYKPTGTGKLNIEVKNEAYETHYIRRAELLAIPNWGEKKVFYNEGQFYYADNISPPVKINRQDKEYIEMLTYKDREFMPSYSDSLDLNQKESIILDFEEFDGQNSGIVITQKQSLMTTFLFYQSMAHMGTQLGDLIAAYENSTPFLRRAQKSMYDILGGVEVSVKANNKWKSIGRIDEQGPITTDTHILPVNYDGKIEQVKLTMTKGLWRIDQVSVCEIIDKATPLIIQPEKLINEGNENKELLDRLNDSESMLVTIPGTSYTLVYDLPSNTNQSLFIKTQGYYTEWMREEWLKEEDMGMVNLLISEPEEWLRLMSPHFKQVEAEMDSLFWSSKFGSNVY